MTNANIIKVDRLRMGTDGQGITTLVAFYGCPLICKYCINDLCHSINHDSVISAEELYNQIKIDSLYFDVTGGGVTFGGGEPLLQAEFISDVLALGANKWHTTIETSLNVDFEKWKCLVEIVDEFIIDIKDMNESIYRSYTGMNNNIVKANLRSLSKLGFVDKVLIRLPLIDGYNNDYDINESLKELERLGYKRFDKFKYKIL